MAKGSAPTLAKGVKSGSLTKGSKKGKGGFVSSPAQMIAKKGKC
jgi:hypothetical protein